MEKMMERMTIAEQQVEPSMRNPNYKGQ